MGKIHFLNVCRVLGEGGKGVWLGIWQLDMKVMEREQSIIFLKKPNSKIKIKPTYLMKTTSVFDHKRYVKGYGRL